MSEARPTSTGADDAPAHRYTAALADRIERRWQEVWEERGTFRALNPDDPGFDASKPKTYILDMFPYPSGSGLHVGHPEGYTATDILARYRRMCGHNVLHPMGWDAFGLPAEQYAVQTNVHPRVTTQRAIETFRRQLKRFGFSYDWSREISTIDPGYYKWTQWIFLRCYNAWYDRRANGGKGAARPIQRLIDDLANERLLVSPSGELKEPPAGSAAIAGLAGSPGSGGTAGALRTWVELSEEERRAVIDSQRLAYLGEQTVNWCPELGTVLANEEVIDGRSERGGFPVTRVAMKQWVFRITSYAERLLEDLRFVDWPESTRTQQEEWIGRSEGAEVEFALTEEGGKGGESIRVFTTRPDTLFGATYLVLAPEHPLVADITTPARRAEVVRYIESVSGRLDIERQESKEKTGVFTGAHAVNPATGEPIPIWIADYVLMGYGTGAIMAVPAHDERDFEFARAFNLPIRDAVLTPPLAAVASFCAKWTPDAAPGVAPEELLADYVGVMVSRSVMDEEEAFRYAASGRVSADPGVREELKKKYAAADAGDGAATQEGLLGGVTGERRGLIASVWRDALEPMLEQGIDALIEAAADGRLVETLGRAAPEPGVNVHSSNSEVSLNGLHTPQAKKAMIEWLETSGNGRRTVNFKLRDWLFSRQRYWGEPFPMVYDEEGRAHPLPEVELPVTLPEIEDFKPVKSDTPSPPLGRAGAWRDVEIGGQRYRRETNTMPNWAGSCWYYLRYVDPTNKQRFVGRDAERYWMGEGEQGGVDLYMGGAEHAVLHLLYARFWHKMLFDLGEVSTPEPFRRLRHQGLILSYAYQRKNGGLVPTDEVEEVSEGKFVERATREPVSQIVAKMSKSLKNVVNPDDVIAEFGADTFRLYEMYVGPIEASKPWNPRDIVGPFRFLQRLWRLVFDESTGELRALPDDKADPRLDRLLHRMNKKVGDDIEALSFNTAIAAMIEFVNEATKTGATRSQLARLARVLCPFAPHIAEEIWARLGHTSLCSLEPWPTPDGALLVDQSVEIVVQVNGKVRGKMEIPTGADAVAMEAAFHADPRAAEWLQGKTPRKVIAVPGRLINVVL